ILSDAVIDGVHPNPEVTERESPTSLPAAGGPTAISGNSSSTTTYSLSNTSLDFTFALARGSSYASGSFSYATIFFRPSSTVGYALSGAYASDDADGRNNILQVELDDRTAGPLYFSDQESLATVGESFTLGGLGGDASNTLDGSPTGTLIANHDYELLVIAQLAVYPSAATTGAQATGYVSLAFVPEPSPGLLLAMGMLGRAAGRGRA